MTDRKISLAQMMTVLFLTLFPLGTELLPGRLQGPAAWLCPLAVGAVVLGIAALAGRWELLSQRDLGQRIADRWGRRTGQILTGVFLAWGLFLMTAHACRIGSRLSDSLRASPVLLTAVILLLAGWMAVGGLPAFARACEVFALAIGFGFFLIVLFGVFRLRWDFLLLWKAEDLAQVPGGAVATAGTLAVGCYAFFLLGDVTPAQRTRRTVLLRLGGLFLLLSAALVLVLGRLGPALTERINRPFFQMVSGLGFEGAFQRLEELVSALWVLGDAALLGLLLLCLRRLLAQMTGQEERPYLGWVLAGTAFFLSLNFAFWNDVLVSGLLPWGNLAAGALMLLLLGLTKENSKNLKKGIDK